MAFILFTFLIAMAISSVAAYFSLVGMGTLFAATFWGVVIMAGTLEVGKIVATKWVHANWRNPRAPWYFRGLFCVFIAALMIITSLGIYGYLSKGHLEQKAPIAGLEIQVNQLEVQIQQKQAENQQLQTRLDQISRITDKSLEKSGTRALWVANSQKKEAANIQDRINDNFDAINALNTKLVPLKTQGAEVEAKLGPVKYVAELFGLKDPEYAVRIVICIIMVAFDPLALSLFIAGSISLTDWREKRQAEKANSGQVLPKEELQTSLPMVDEPQPADSILEQLDPIEGEGHSVDIQDFNKAFDDERREFETVRSDLEQQFIQQAADLDKRATTIQQDEEALQTAHQQLLEMEARLTDERDLLKQWEDQLTQQQTVINNWVPPSEDTRSDKEKIIEMLERNPQVVNEIVSVVDAMRPPFRPGL